MARKVIVKWNVEQVSFSGADKADHYVVALGQVEVNVPLTAREHTFDGVDAGELQGFVVLADKDGNEMALPATYSVTVPEDPKAPIPVQISAAIG
jgi:hypothetical protein